MPVTDTILADTAQICADIRALPFDAALTDGTRRAETFRHSIIQDAHYLKGVARCVARAAAPDTPCRAWIDEYSGAEFDAAVTAMSALADRLAAQATPDEVGCMHAACVRSTPLQWMFRRSAWHRRGWPDTGLTTGAAA